MNLLTQAAYDRYMWRLAYRKIADLFDDLLHLKLSAASAWHCIERVAQAGREEYNAIREESSIPIVSFLRQRNLYLSPD